MTATCGRRGDDPPAGRLLVPPPSRTCSISEPWRVPKLVAARRQTPGVGLLGTLIRKHGDEITVISSRRYSLVHGVVALPVTW